MTPSTPLQHIGRLVDAVPAERVKRVVPRVEYGAPTGAVRAVAFYAAIALPFVYLPMVAGGLTGEELTLVSGLLLANAAALVLGHGHGIE